MRKIKEILRLKWLEGRRHRHIARALKVSVGKVSAVGQRAAEVGLEWERVEQLAETELEAAIYGAVSRKLKAPLPDPAWMDLELKKAGVTLQLLHVEYREHHPDGYGYTQFCEHYRRWKKKQKLVMRQVHRAGEKVFTDFAGKKPHWIDPTTGEAHEVELFVAALGASNLTYAEALESQKVAHWIAAHTRALEYFQGVPELVVPDQLRSAVTGPCRYEPEIQRTFEEWGRHYATVILPARPAHRAVGGGRRGYRAVYRRSSRLFDELTLARADGTYARLLARLARIDVLVIDDFGIASLEDQQRQDLLEDRHDLHSTVVASQLPVPKWHAHIEEPMLADAICERLLHNAHRLVLKGPTRRKLEARTD